MSDLGPVRKLGQGSGISGDNGSKNATAATGSNNDSSSNALSSLEAERARIRTELPNEQAALEDAKTLASHNSTVVNNATDAHNEARATESSSIIEAD